MVGIPVALVALLIGCGGDGERAPPGADTGLAQVPAALIAAGPVTCADPGSRSQARFDRFVGPSPAGPPVLRGYGAGIAAGDLDGDGLDDVVVLGRDGAEAWRQTAPGVFTDLGGYAWAGLDLGFGLNVVDFDGDRDLDLFVTRYGGDNLLLQNDGAGRFTDVAADRGLARCGTDHDHRSSSSVWGDIDNDGDLDLYVGGHGFVDEEIGVEWFGDGDRDCLFANDGVGGFTDISLRIPGGVHNAYALVPTFVDLNRDGWLDLYVANDFGAKHTPCLLVWNRQGVFEPDYNEARLNARVSGMGIGIGDVNEDGTPDLLVSAWGKNAYLISHPDRATTWVDWTQAAGLTGDPALNQVVGWGTELADMDLDTDLDAVMVFGFIDTNTGVNAPEQPDAIWLQQDDGTMEQVSADWGVLEPTDARGLLVTDLNRDGYPDLGIPDLSGPTVLHLSRCGDRSWLEVALRAPPPNTFAVGARIRVDVGERSWERTVRAGGTSYGSSGPPVVHFGLDAHATVDRLHVTWPDGQVSWFDDVPARQLVTIER